MFNSLWFCMWSIGIIVILAYALIGRVIGDDDEGRDEK